MMLGVGSASGFGFGDLRQDILMNLSGGSRVGPAEVWGGVEVRGDAWH